MSPVISELKDQFVTSYLRFLLVPVLPRVVSPIGRVKGSCEWEATDLQIFAICVSIEWFSAYLRASKYGKYTPRAQCVSTDNIRAQIFKSIENLRYHRKT